MENSFDLDKCTKIYDILGIKITWLDYSYPDKDGWNEVKFYSDFDKMWNELTDDKKELILNSINN